jgi:hypothetical protein
MSKLTNKINSHKNLFIFLLLFLYTQFIVGANLVENGNLIGDIGALIPPGWVFQGSDINYVPSGSPHHGGVVTIQNSTPGKPVLYCYFRQFNLKLEPGEKYSLSFSLKTNKATWKALKFVIHNHRWNKSAGFFNLPRNSQKWITIKKEFIAPPTSNKYYGIAFYVRGFSGIIRVADIAVKPLSAKALKAAALSDSTEKKYLVPMCGTLEAVPAKFSRLKLAWPYSVNKKTKCQILVDGQIVTDVQFKNESWSFPLADFRKGQHEVQAKVIENKRVLGKCCFKFTCAAKQTKKHWKRLNSMTRQLLQKNISGKTLLNVDTPNNGWVYFQFESADDFPCEIIMPNGEKIILTNKINGENYTQRFFKQGSFQLICRAKKGCLTINAVPYIYRYGTQRTEPFVPGTGLYDEAFEKKYYNGIYNLLGARGIKSHQRTAQFNKTTDWMESYSPLIFKRYSLQTAKKINKQIQYSARLTKIKSPWIEFDEFHWRNLDDLRMHADSFKFVRNPQKKKFFFWFTSEPGPNKKGLHHYFASQALNIDNGRGYLVKEVYFQPQASEKLAKLNIQFGLKYFIKQMEKFIPGSVAKLGLVFTNMSQIPVYSVDNRPDVNFKYFLDLEFNILANSSFCNNIGVVGYWGNIYTDEDVNRWSSALIKHYILEGRKDMLSSRYGYQYRLNYLKNPDFENNLQGWKTEGNISAIKIPGYAAKVQKRWAAKNGNIAALFKGDVKPNRLSQHIKGLIPGKTYKLIFATADYRDIKAKRNKAKLNGLNFKLKDVEIIKQIIFPDTSKRHKKPARCTLYYLVFKAKSNSHELIFYDRAKLGEELILNYVKLEPYFD